MNEILLRALDLARQRGARYADARVVIQRVQNIAVQNGVVESIRMDESAGFGVRVLVDDGWGFAASYDLSGPSVDQVTHRALGLARAAMLAAPRRPVDLGPAVTSRGVYRTPLRTDPLQVPTEAKLSLLMAAEAAMARVPGATLRRGSLFVSEERRLFANTEGALTDQTIVETGGGLAVTAVGNGEVQTRSYPNALGGHCVTGGWEAVLDWDLPGHGERVATEAVQLLSADPCPRDLRTTLILGGAQLAMQVHESCGHAVELDRVFGMEAGYAGTSFLTPEKRDTFRYGAECVNLVADATVPLGLGTFGWDDEGVPAQRTALVRGGQFAGYLMSREAAGWIEQPSNGCMRAAGWNRLPLIRMTNVNLEPGDWGLDDLIADTESGVFMDITRSWSIDDRRYNFQFGTELGYEINHGKLGRMLRNCTYTGATPEFWRSCDAVCNANHWTIWGTLLCGKGQPSQIMHTGHGAAPARFRDVRIGVA